MLSTIAIVTGVSTLPALLIAAAVMLGRARNPEFRAK
jgi:hypothetical protein